MDALPSFFSTENFMPHGHCYLWFPHILWLHLISDALIALAYFAIPLALFRLAQRRPDIGLNWAIYLFVAFIVLCGLTHVMAIYTIWNPVYFPQGLLKAVTAGASVATAIAIWPLLPKLIAAPSLSQLEAANEKLAAANAALKTSEERLELAVNAGGVGLWDWDIGTNRVWYSDVWLDHLGYRPGEVLDRYETWERNLHPEDSDRAVKELWGHLKKGTDYKSQFRILSKSGKYIWVEAFGVANRNVDGEPYRMSGTLINITDKKEREHESEQTRLFLSSVLENIQDGIIACNERGELTLFNLAARQFHGAGVKDISPEQWAQEYNLYEADGATPLPLYRTPLYRALKGEIVESQEIVIAPKDRPSRRMVAKAKPLLTAQGKHIGAVAGMHDITLEREREEALRRS
ncbi:MAG: PAS domain-containing protein, partial [Oricola sp.]|nr:PAS domain-containing protein [Oricola sp.]